MDKDDDGNYLISARHASALYKINGHTGDIIWQLGGRKSSFSYDSDLEFGFQHDARFVRKSESSRGVEYVSLFDNAARANGHRGGGVEIVHSKSHAKIIRLNKSAWTASLEVSLSSPDGLLAPSQGNVQTLPNSNLFVNWGQGGAVTEFRAGDGEPIFHAYLDSGEIGQGVQSYRGFRFPWIGAPTEAPAIIASVNDNGITTIYVSWNGDTRTTKWRFYTTADFGAARLRWSTSNKHILGETERTGFETSFILQDMAFDFTSSISCPIFAEALDLKGNILVATGAALVAKTPDAGRLREVAQGLKVQGEL